MSDDLISRQEAIDAIEALGAHAEKYVMGDGIHGFQTGLAVAKWHLECLPSAESEKTVYIPETKAIPTARSCVDLAEKVTATYYDAEHEEWTRQTVTIADVLDSVCDEYTILPSVESEPCDFCVYKDDCEMRIYCPARPSQRRKGADDED